MKLQPERTDIDHDRLFKELFSTFFFEFIDLFLPEMSAYIDKSVPPIPMDKEVFTDVTAGKKHTVDLIMKVKFRGKDAFFIIHVENQASAQSDFPRRMFKYFARLYEEYNIDIYPIVVFSYDRPLRAEPTRHIVKFPNLTVLDFKYTVIQLNRISWRRFVNNPNPVASALMAKMKMSPADRPKVKLECLRLLATLQLNPAKAKLIGGFVETYLKLSATEMKRYEREFAKLEPEEQEQTMEVLTYWEQKGLDQGIEKGLLQGMEQGLQQGLLQGMERMIVRQINRRFGSVTPQIMERLNQLTPDQLDELGVALFDFTMPADLENWLANPPAPMTTAPQKKTRRRTR